MKLDEDKRERVSVMEIQDLPPEKVEQLYNKVISGEVVLISIYPDRWSQIGLQSPQLKKFARKKQGLQIGAMAKIMKILAKEWLDEDEKTISRQAKSKNTEIIQAIEATGFHCKKVL
ncbi:hypothetical protein DRQ33_03615 [bacterium]|nr:MAG: hypothetical protein DRQ33_03615 [bacterium]